jgi:hypothetical protein
MLCRSLEKNTSCDLVGWVKEMGNYVEFRSRTDK